jgi:hypothetical protein
VHICAVTRRTAQPPSVLASHCVAFAPAAAWSLLCSHPCNAPTCPPIVPPLLLQCSDGAAIQEYLGELTGGRSVPRVFVGGKFIGGGDDTDVSFTWQQPGSLTSKAGHAGGAAHLPAHLHSHTPLARLGLRIETLTPACLPPNSPAGPGAQWQAGSDAARCRRPLSTHHPLPRCCGLPTPRHVTLDSLPPC